jgi:hypothetical protein
MFSPLRNMSIKSHRRRVSARSVVRQMKKVAMNRLRRKQNRIMGAFILSPAE